MPVTIHDVAGAAGGSVKTVSRVINNERWVQAETRARVMQAIEDLDFHPNVLARNLVAKRTRTMLRPGWPTLWHDTAPPPSTA